MSEENHDTLLPTYDFAGGIEKEVPTNRQRFDI
jgi:hypothetical protein